MNKSLFKCVLESLFKLCKMMFLFFVRTVVVSKSVF